MNGLKLFVVGESSGNPDDWHAFGGYSLVLAMSPEEATRLAGDYPAVEVSLDKSRLLLRVSLADAI